MVWILGKYYGNILENKFDKTNMSRSEITYHMLLIIQSTSQLVLLDYVPSNSIPKKTWLVCILIA